MKRLLLMYQIAVACSDTLTGAGLMIVPQFTLGMMGISVAPETDVLMGYIGSFVFGVGLLCACGVPILLRKGSRDRMEMLWLATAILRSSVAVYVAVQVFTAHLSAPWLQIAAFDAVCAGVQGIGLRRRWLSHVTC